MVSYAGEMNKSLVGRLIFVSLALCAGLSSGCPGNDAVADAGAAAPCTGDVPGVRVHLSFAEPGFGGAPSWSASDEALKIATTGGGSLGYQISPTVVDAQRQAVVSVAYPPGTSAGPANVSFYAIANGLTQWESDTVAFTADPAACVDVNLAVRFVDITDIDAGVSDAAAP